MVDELPNVAPVNVAILSSAGDPYLNVMIPGMVMSAMSGGPNTVLNLTYRLAREGVPVRYISTDVPPDSGPAIWRHLGALTGIEAPPTHVEIVSGRSERAAQIGAADVFLASAWWTAHMINRVLPKMQHRRFLYMVQDFEPGFYPWSTAHALALETYGWDFLAIVNESLLLEHLAQNGVGRFGEPEFAAKCASFEPAVDRTRFHDRQRPANDPDGRRRLLFYARPSAPRNLYELGLVALKRAADRGAFASGRWELYLMGEQKLLPSRLAANVVIRPLEWLDYDGYAQLLRSSHVGLALMLSPHTGYPALEMAACGMRTITNTYSVKTPERLQAISPGIAAVAPTADAIAAAIEQAVAEAEMGLPDTRATCALPSAWDDVLDPLVPRIIQMIENCRTRDG